MINHITEGPEFVCWLLKGRRPPQRDIRMKTSSWEDKPCLMLAPQRKWVYFTPSWQEKEETIYWLNTLKYLWLFQDVSLWCAGHTRPEHYSEPVYTGQRESRCRNYHPREEQGPASQRSDRSGEAGLLFQDTTHHLLQWGGDGRPRETSQRILQVMITFFILHI